MEEDAIRDLVIRLARPDARGGHTVERAAILAAGRDSAAVEAWIVGQGGRPEHARRPHHGGLHQATRDGESRRFILPRGSLKAAVPPTTTGVTP